jgi:hypothetical protein
VGAKAVSFFIRDRLTKKDIESAFATFQRFVVEDDPLGYGWAIKVAPDRYVFLEDGTEGISTMPPEMVRKAAKALRIRFGKPKSRLIAMFDDTHDPDEDDLVWRAVFDIARVFNKRWPTVVDDHAGTTYDFDDEKLPR